MSRRRTIALAVVVVPATIVVLLWALLSWLLLTQSGLDWATDLARRNLPEGITFERAEGRLAGPLTVERIAVDVPAARVTIRRLALDWRPLALLRGRARVSALVLDAVDIALPAEPGRDTADSRWPPQVPVPPRDLALPFSVVVDRVSVGSLALRLPDGRVERVERVAAGAELGPDGAALREVELRAPLADLDGSLHLGGTHPVTVTGGIDWELRPRGPEIPPMAGRLDLSGTLDDLRLALRWHAPAPARVVARASLFGQSPRWSAEVGVPVTGLRQWWRPAPELAVGADLELAGSLERATVRGGLDVQGLPIGPLRARLQASASAESLQLERLQLEPERYPGMSLDGSGRLELAAAPVRFRASADWRGARWPLEGAPLVSSESGRMTAQGTLDAYELEAEAQLRTPQTGSEPVRAELRASGSSEALSTLDLRAAWHEARLQADGRLRWRPAGSAQLGFALTQFDPGRLAPELSGRLALRGRVQSTWDETLTAALDLQSLQGELNGQDVSGSARVRHGAGGTRIETLTLAAGGARARASGTFDDALAFDWSVAVPRLGELVPGWHGRIDASGRLGGTPAAPRVTVRAQAGDVATPFVRLAGLDIDGELAPLGGADSSLVARAAGVAVEAATLQSLELRVSGTPERHRIELRVRSDRGDAEVAATGAAAATDWSGQLLRATLVPAGLGRWELAAPSPIQWRGGELDAGPACWRRDRARLCAAASGTPGDWRGELDARSIPVGLVAGLARDDLDYSGTFALQARAAVGDDGPTGRALLELSAGRITGVVEGERETLLDYGSGRAAVHLAPEAIEVEAALPLADDGVVRLDGRLGRAEPRALEARLQARVRDLGLVPVFAPQVGRIEGLLLADIELGGTLARPTAAGDARLEDGRVELAQLGIELSGVRADLSTRDDAFDIGLSAHSGDGELAAQIRLQRTAERAWRGSGTLAGEAFRAVNLPEAEVVVSPALDWRLEGRALTVSGRVVVPRARIEPRDLSRTVQESPDAVVVGTGQPADTGPPIAIDADIEVVLGPEVRIDAFGLEGRLEGAIRVRERPGQLASATGELRVVEGTYTFYRQRLEIERGRVIYDGGPASNPGLDVRAVRRPRNVVVGAHVRGTLRDPRIELFSEPPMEESQQLSYLLLGVPLRETKGGEQSGVAAAAAALASSRQGGALADRVGIQQVEVDRGEEGEGTSIVLGRYLSPRLYVGYGVGLMEQANSVRMRYDLTQQWTVEARSGVNSSADLLYSIEVDSSVDAIPQLPLIDLGGERPAAAE